MQNGLGIHVVEAYHLCGLDFPTGISKDYEDRIEKNVQATLELLGRFKTKATFFILGVVAEKYPNIVKRIQMADHEIASHGYKHLEVFKHTKYSFREDLKKSLDILGSITGKNIIGYRAPDFSITNQALWAVDILQEEGIKYDSSIFPIRHPRYGIPSAPFVPYRIRPEIVEFSPSTMRILGENVAIAGGTPFKILPYFLIEQTIKSLNKRNIPANMYIKLWELDPEYLRFKLPLRRRWAEYHKIERIRPRLEKLLVRFSFNTLVEALNEGGY